MSKLKRLLSVLPALSLCGLQPAQAAVNDIFPGDFYPLEPGASTVSLYAFDRTHQGPYVQGRKALDGRIDSTAYALRLTHGYRAADTTFSAVAVLSGLNAVTSPAPLSGLLGKEAQGLADLRLGLTAWLINDKASANYLTLSGMLIAPTGAYDHGQVLNPGEHRWKSILFGGWQKDITPKILFELSPEVVWYGENTDYPGKRTLAQRLSYALTGYLRWRVSPAWHVHVGSQLNRGGATHIDALAQNNPANNTRFMAGMTWFLPGQQQLILRAARDAGIDNGFRLNREIALRYQIAF